MNFHFKTLRGDVLFCFPVYECWLSKFENFSFLKNLFTYLFLEYFICLRERENKLRRGAKGKGEADPLFIRESNMRLDPGTLGLLLGPKADRCLTDRATQAPPKFFPFKNFSLQNMSRAGQKWRYREDHCVFVSLSMWLWAKMSLLDFDRELYISLIISLD